MITGKSLPAEVPGEDRPLARSEPGSEGIPVEDASLAMEIAEFVAERAQSFDDSECRAWALTDFGVWAVLAGRSPRLSLKHEQPSSDVGENVP